MGYVRSDKPIDRNYVMEGEYELEVATRRVSAQVTLVSLYDPEMQHVKNWNVEKTISSFLII